MHYCSVCRTYFFLPLLKLSLPMHAIAQLKSSGLHVFRVYLSVFCLHVNSVSLLLHLHILPLTALFLLVVCSSSSQSVKCFDTTTFLPPFSSQGIHVRIEAFLYDSQIPGHEMTPALTWRRWWWGGDGGVSTPPVRTPPGRRPKWQRKAAM